MVVPVYFLDKAECNSFKSYYRHHSKSILHWANAFVYIFHILISHTLSIIYSKTTGGQVDFLFSTFFKCHKIAFKVPIC